MSLTKTDLEAIRSIVREETEPRFESLEVRINSVEISIDKRFESLEVRINSIEKSVDKRFTSVDKKLEIIVQEMVRFTGELYADHEERIVSLEQRSHL